jgi:3-methylcrotonyl-CoA carboxylase alpha subunit
LRVASGEKLPKTQKQIRMKGHAVEARLYAEDPGSVFLPSIGKLERQRIYTSDPLTEFSSGRRVRIDTGVEEGDAISQFYDPMIAKIIAVDRTREDAVGLLGVACGETRIWPVKTNASFLAALCREPDFLSGGVSTGYIAEHAERLIAQPPASTDLEFKAALWLDFASPLRSGPQGFRMNAAPASSRVVWIDGERTILEDSQQIYAVGQNQFQPDFELQMQGIEDFGDSALVFSDGRAYHLSLTNRV